MASQNGNTKIAREYRTKYPDFPTKKLARVMYAENNLAFKDEEVARTCLRYVDISIDNYPSVNNLISQGFKFYSPEYAYGGREMLYFQKSIN